MADNNRQGHESMIGLQGIVRNTAPNTSADGEMEEVVNLRFKDGHLIPVNEHEQPLGAERQYIGYDYLFIHSNEYQHLLGVRGDRVVYFADIDNDNAVTLLVSPVELMMVEVTEEVGVQYTQTGNLVTVIDGTQLKYLYWRKDHYQVLQSDYNGTEDADTLNPEGNVEFRVVRKQYKDTGFGTIRLVRTENPMSSIIESHVEKDKELKDQSIGLMEKSRAYSRKKGEPTGYFYVCTALKLYDGSYILQSRPLLMKPANDYYMREDTTKHVEAGRADGVAEYTEKILNREKYYLVRNAIDTQASGAMAEQTEILGTAATETTAAVDDFHCYEMADDTETGSIVEEEIILEIVTGSEINETHLNRGCVFNPSAGNRQHVPLYKQKIVDDNTKEEGVYNGWLTIMPAIDDLRCFGYRDLTTLINKLLVSSKITSSDATSLGLIDTEGEVLQKYKHNVFKIFNTERNEVEYIVSAGNTLRLEYFKQEGKLLTTDEDASKFLYCANMPQKLQYKVNTNIDASYEDIVESVCVFITPQIEPYWLQDGKHSLNKRDLKGVDFFGTYAHNSRQMGALLVDTTSLNDFYVKNSDGDDITDCALTLSRRIRNSVGDPYKYNLDAGSGGLHGVNLYPTLKTQAEVIEELEKNAVFYKVHEIKFADYKPGGWVDIDLEKDGILEMLYAKVDDASTLEVDSSDRNAYAPKASLMYNGRLHIANYSESMFRGWPLSYFFMPTPVGKLYGGGFDRTDLMDGQYPTKFKLCSADKESWAELLNKAGVYQAWSETDIETSEGISTVRRVIPCTEKGTKIFNLNPLLSYPDIRAKKMRICVSHISRVRYDGTNYYYTLKIWENRFELKPHPTYDFAYYIAPDLRPIDLMPDDGWELTPGLKRHGSLFVSHPNGISAADMTAYLEGLDGIADIKDYVARSATSAVEFKPNAMRVSKLDSPMVFPSKTFYHVGNQAIIAMATNAQVNQTGQDGDAPLYVLAKDGVYGLFVDASGQLVYSNSRPISRDICNNWRSVTHTDAGVCFSSDRGIIMLNGLKATDISDVIEGAPCDFTNSEAVEYMAVAKKASEHIQLTTLSLEHAYDGSDFLDYVKGCIIGYSYRLKELWVTNPDYAYSYVFSNGAWVKVMQVCSQYVNNYPEILMLRDRQLYVIGRETESGAEIALLTRPIKYKTENFKQTYRAILRSFLRMQPSYRREVITADDIYERTRPRFKEQSLVQYRVDGLEIKRRSDEPTVIDVFRKPIWDGVKNYRATSLGYAFGYTAVPLAVKEFPAQGLTSQRRNYVDLTYEIYNNVGEDYFFVMNGKRILVNVKCNGVLPQGVGNYDRLGDDMRIAFGLTDFFPIRDVVEPDVAALVKSRIEDTIAGSVATVTVLAANDAVMSKVYYENGRAFKSYEDAITSAVGNRDIADETVLLDESDYQDNNISVYSVQTFSPAADAIFCVYRNGVRYTCVNGGDDQSVSVQDFLLTYFRDGIDVCERMIRRIADGVLVPMVNGVDYTVTDDDDNPVYDASSEDVYLRLHDGWDYEPYEVFTDMSEDTRMALTDDDEWSMSFVFRRQEDDDTDGEVSLIKYSAFRTECGTFNNENEDTAHLLWAYGQNVWRTAIVSGKAGDWNDYVLYDGHGEEDRRITGVVRQDFSVDTAVFVERYLDYLEPFDVNRPIPERSRIEAYTHLIVNDTRVESNPVWRHLNIEVGKTYTAEELLEMESVECMADEVGHNGAQVVSVGDDDRLYCDGVLITTQNIDDVLGKFDKIGYAGGSEIEVQPENKFYHLTIKDADGKVLFDCNYQAVGNNVSFRGTFADWVRYVVSNPSQFRLGGSVEQYDSSWPIMLPVRTEIEYDGKVFEITPDTATRPELYYAVPIANDLFTAAAAGLGVGDTAALSDIDELPYTLRCLDGSGARTVLHAGIYVFGSYDARRWQYLGGQEISGTSRDIGTTVNRTDCKYFRVLFVGNVSHDSSVEYLDTSIKGKLYSGKLR